MTNSGNLSRFAMTRMSLSFSSSRTTSLGCPKKGMAYPQMTVEGELLRLSIGQRVLEYHARAGGSFAFLAAMARVVPSIGP